MVQESDPVVDSVTSIACGSALRPRFDDAGSTGIGTSQNSSGTGALSSLAGNEASYEVESEETDTQERSSVTVVKQERNGQSFAMNNTKTGLQGIEAELFSNTVEK